MEIQKRTNIQRDGFLYPFLNLIIRECYLGHNILHYFSRTSVPLMQSYVLFNAIIRTFKIHIFLHWKSISHFLFLKKQPCLKVKQTPDIHFWHEDIIVLSILLWGLQDFCWFFYVVTIADSFLSPSSLLDGMQENKVLNLGNCF